MEKWLIHSFDVSLPVKTTEQLHAWSSWDCWKIETEMHWVIYETNDM